MKNCPSLINSVGYTIGLLAIIVLFSGCATTTHQNPKDPWENWNRNVHGFNEGFDDYVGKPVAKGYQWITPSFVDLGVTNFFSNIQDIGVTLNDLLQAKFKQGGLDGTRFLINSVLGIGGFFDVATELDFEKHEEDFGQTLGAWGIPTGPYIVIPILGPSSARGITGLIADAAMNPLTYVDPAAVPLATGTLRFIDIRADLLSASRIAEEAAVDRYDFDRNAYLQRRRYLVYDGNVPLDEGDLDEELFDEELDNEDDLESDTLDY